MRTLTDDEIARAVNHIKEAAPKLWVEVLSRERSGAELSDIAGELLALAKEVVPTSELRELTKLMLGIRGFAFKEARAN